ncbi:hypothetical protein ACFOY4_07120 [Actinomadura syzygii]|uniref:Uncharacterized protein n=1 Tax=Actinomadura syzygii TaxID=1427538 RepID=A0A5D0UFQ5_9ACTN|nr:hypothetical protein [Actinomadura syzygii]TYC16884.1 hypothetical protein FXF65_10160 [Actinomadura syzygii]
MSDEAAEEPVIPASAAVPAVAEGAEPQERAAVLEGALPEEAAPEEVGGEPEFPAVPVPEPTGEPRVDAALARLGELGGRPVSAHVEVFEDVHQRLQEILAAAGEEEERPRPAFPDALRPPP